MCLPLLRGQWAFRVRHQYSCSLSCLLVLFTFLCAIFLKTCIISGEIPMMPDDYGSCLSCLSKSHGLSIVYNCLPSYPSFSPSWPAFIFRYKGSVQGRSCSSCSMSFSRCCWWWMVLGTKGAGDP